MGTVVNLSWSSHARVFTSGIWNLFKEKYKTDFEVSLNGNYISTHQIILAIFCPSIKNSLNNTVILGEDSSVTKLDLDNVIEFLYRGEINVSEDRLPALMKISEHLGFTVLSDLITAEEEKLTLNKKLLAVEKEQRKVVYKSSIKIMPDRSRKKRTNTRFSSSKIEFIKLPSKAFNNLKGLTVKSVTSAKSKSEIIVETSSVEESADVDKSNVEELQGTEVDSESQPFKRVTRCRDDLSLESFDPQTFEFICKHCSKGYVKANDLYNHLRVHEQSTIRFECQHCDYKTNNRTCFSGHMINRHQMDIHGNLRPKDLQCPQCSYMCSVNFQLKNHIYLVHSVKKKVCDGCGYRCQSKATLEKHKRLVHSNAKPLMCETCGYRAKIFADLHRHMRVHFCSKVTCDICGATVSANHLTVHKKIHSNNPKPFACHICTFTSWKNWNLKVHLRSVHHKDVDRTKLDLPS
ncbi:hypothetical protein CHUAL_005570 [Chamberlinius hualienensis]